MLLAALADTARRQGYWCLRGTIFAENAASITLHHQAGFRRVGVLEEIALMTYGPYAGNWRDTVLFQLRL